MNNFIEISQLIEGYPKVFDILKSCPYSILKEFKIETFSKGKFLLKQQSIYEYIYIIVKGEIDIFIQSDSGRKVSLDIYSSGNFIGEHEILQQIPFSSSVQSLSEVTLLKLPRQYFLMWMELDNNLALKLIKSLCNQIYNLSKLTESYSLFSTKRQVAEVLSLLQQSEEYLERNTLLMKISSTPRSVDRVLKELKELKIISNHNGVIRVKNLKELKEFGVGE